MSASEIERQRVESLYQKAQKLGVIAKEMSRSHFELQLKADEASANGVMWMMGYQSNGKSTLVDDLFPTVDRPYHGVVQGRSGTDPNSFIWLHYLNPINEIKVKKI